MDGQRFDDLARAMATGTTRRRVLRLGSGGLAAALLAAVGRSDRARAEAIFTNCVDYGAPGGESGGAIVTVQPGEQVLLKMPCGACPGDRVCQALLSPANDFICRCVEL